jgi:hypothetical protein
MGVSIAYFWLIAKIELFKARPTGIDDLMGMALGKLLPLLPAVRA